MVWFEFAKVDLLRSSRSLHQDLCFYEHLQLSMDKGALFEDQTEL
jgi:hypothetical protein